MKLLLGCLSLCLVSGSVFGQAAGHKIDEITGRTVTVSNRGGSTSEVAGHFAVTRRSENFLSELAASGRTIYRVSASSSDSANDDDPVVVNDPTNDNAAQEELERYVAQEERQIATREGEIATREGEIATREGEIATRESDAPVEERAQAR